jgi:membrane fusion protein (multidrug efflux system)
MAADQAQPAVQPASPPPAPRRKKLIYGGIFALLVLAGGVVGLYYYLYSLAHEWTDDAFIEGHVIQVSSRVPGRVLRVLVHDNQDVKAGDLLAEIDPRDFEVRLAQARAGLAAAEAQKKTAETQVTLVKAVTSSSLDQAAAGVKEAESGAAMAQAGMEVAKSKQLQADAGLASSRATAARAKAAATAAEAEKVRTASDLARYKELFEAKRISPLQFDAATAAATAAAAQHEAARQGALAAEAGVTVAEADIKVAADNLKLAEAQVAQAEAKIAEQQAKLADAQAAPHRIAAAESQLAAATADLARLRALVEQAELELSYTKVTASEDGLVTRKTVEPGAMFQAGQAMMALVPANVWVVANFKESALGRIRPGQRVEVTVDAHSGKVFKAHVDSIQSGTGARFSLLPPENATGNYVKVVQRVPVKIVFDEPPDPAYRLAPGLSVIPTVEIE